MSSPSRRDVLKGVGAGTALLTAGVSVSSADGHTDQHGKDRTAKVRVGHLAPDAPNVDVYVDGNKVVSDLAYSNFDPKGFSGEYYDLPPGEYDITTKIAGTDETISALSVAGFTIKPDTNYTVLATGELNPEDGSEPGLELLPLVDNGNDDTALPPADATLVRLVHASPDAGEVDLVIKQHGTTVDTIEGVTFGQDTGYLELPPGDYTVDVGPGALSISASLPAGTKVSGYVIGNATTDHEDDAALSAVGTLEATNLGGGRGDKGRTAGVRVGHLSPDAPNVDVYVDGNKVVSDLAYSNFDPKGLSGKYYELPPGEYDITTRVAKDHGKGKGKGKGEKIPQLSVSGFSVEPDTSYTVLATGELNPEDDSEAELGLLPLVDNGNDDTALPPADATLVRLVHASPDAGEVDLVIKQHGTTVDTIEGVTFGQDTGYLELPPGDYTVDVGPGAISIPLSLTAGTKVSGYVIGNATTDHEDDAEIGATLSLEATNLAAGKGRGNGRGG